MKLPKLAFLVFCVVSVIGFFLVSSLFGPFHLASKPHFPTKAAAAETLISTRPLISFFVPTPTPTPFPSPVYTGYCLNVPVLMYHHTAPWEIAKTRGFTSLDVDNGMFDQQMSYLASHGYTSIFAEDLVNALKNHTSLPQKSIVISLDDGYDDVYAYAFPVAKKYHIKLTLFIPTGLLGNVSPTNSYYTWAQVKEMLGSGLVSVGNHTWSHFPMGTKGTDKDEYEVSTAQKELQQYLGKSPITFAYPYGTNAGLARLYPILEQNGILGAFSTWGGTVQCDSFMFSLHRTRVGNAPFPGFGIY